MQNKEKVKLRKLINEYKDACVNYSWIDGAHPDLHDDIEWDVKNTTRRLYKFIREIGAMEPKWDLPKKE